MKLVQDLQNQYGEYCIPRVKKLSKCNLRGKVMNQAIKDSCSGPGDAERGKIEQRPAVPFVSEATYDSTEKDKGKYIEITCRHTPAEKDTKKNNYNVHVRIFDHGTPEDMLLWYIKIQDVFLKKPCDDAESRFDITELLLSGQAKRNFLQFKTEICDTEVITEDTTRATKRGITDDTFKEVLEKFRDYAFKKFAARYQVSYLRHSLRKPVGVTIRACAARLQEINNYLKHFPGPDLNTPLADGDLISILVAMVPSQWRRKMISINFEPLNKTMLEVIEYMEQLEVLESTEKKKDTKKTDKEKSENKTDKSKNKSSKSHKKGKKFKKRKRNQESESSDDDSKKFCAFCHANDGPYWTHNTQDCNKIKALRKSKGHKKSYGHKKSFSNPSKEFNALVQAQVNKILKKERNKKRKTSSRSVSDTTDSGSSSGEEWSKFMTISPNRGGGQTSSTTTTVASIKEPTGVPVRLYVLLDTGCSNSLISNKCLPYIKSLKKSKSHYATAGGPYKTSRKGTVTFKLPEFSSSKEISWQMDIDQGKLEELGYDMIMGRDLL